MLCAMCNFSTCVYTSLLCKHEQKNTIISRLMLHKYCSNVAYIFLLLDVLDARIFFFGFKSDTF